MLAIARELPGFISFKADDGKRCTIVEFAPWETHNVWAHHPRHREAQRQGRAGFYAEYGIKVAEGARDSQ